MHTYRVVIVAGTERTTYYLSSRSIDGAVAGAIKEHGLCFPNQTITSIEVAK